MSLRQAIARTMYRGLERTVAPTSEPVSLADLRAHLGLDESGTEDNPRLHLLLVAAREIIEEHTGMALLTQTWRMTLDTWPGAREPWWDGVREIPISALAGNGPPSWLILPRYPLQSVPSVTVYDTANNPQAVPVSSTFVVDVTQKPGRMVLRTGATWPVALRAANAIEITFIAGYLTAQDVPAALRLAIMQVAAYLFTHGGDCTAGNALQQSGAMTMLTQYRAARL